MPVVVRLDVMLALRKKRAKDLAAEIGITEANLSLLRTGKVKGVRFDTLAKLCVALDCKPGDLLDYEHGPETETAPEDSASVEDGEE
jgi:putative transcriptional regulator